MSNEILLGKLSANHTVDVESPIVVEKKKEEKGKKKRQGSLLLFLMAIGLGAAAAVALSSVTLLAPVAFYGRVYSPDSIDDSGSSSGDGPAAASIPTALAASA